MIKKVHLVVIQWDNGNYSILATRFTLVEAQEQLAKAVNGWQRRVRGTKVFLCSPKRFNRLKKNNVK